MFLALTILVAAKPQIVMIHGAGGGGWEYHYWKPVFERAGYKVVAPDLQPSKNGLAKTTLSDYVDQVVRAAAGKPTILIGASMGGMVALKASEKIKPVRLVLVSSTLPKQVLPDNPGQIYPPVIRWKNGPYKDTVDSMPDCDAATWKFAFPRWRDESGAVLNEISGGVLVQKPTCPVLSVIAEGDHTVPPAKQQELAAWAGADTLRFNGMSHVGPLFSRRRVEVANAILVWLSARVR